jgi:hypothetical protein
MAANDILGTADAAHLLRRAGFGATAKDLASFATRTRGAAVDLLLGSKTRRSRPPAGKSGDLALAKMQLWWLKQMPSPKWRLHEKVALFWHAHFATPWSAVPNAAQLARQNGIFRELGLGAFRTLLYEITRDAAMLEFRDGVRSGPADPNENFARALLEQYALGARDLAGMPNYVEADVVAFARGLTGFQLGPKDLAGQVDLEFFDDGTKQVFVGNAAEAVGNLGVEDGDGKPPRRTCSTSARPPRQRGPADRRAFVARKSEWFAIPEPEPRSSTRSPTRRRERLPDWGAVEAILLRRVPIDAAQLDAAHAGRLALASCGASGRSRALARAARSGAWA